MKRIKIGNELIGDGEPSYIIAEAGSNHNGSLEQVKKLIDVAAEAKTDAVKFQIFKAENLYSKEKFVISNHARIRMFQRNIINQKKING